MKKRTFNIFYMVLLSGMLFLITTRCVKLDEKPMDFVSPSNFYQSAPQIEAAFASAMNRLYLYWGGYSWDPMDFENDDQYYGGTLVMSDSYGNNLWNWHYKSIADINPAILALNKDVLGTAATQVEKDQLMAQAKFIRAYNYFVLVRLYGDVPLIMETTNLVTDEIKRTPIREVYAQIESDLLFASQKLPVSWPAERRGRPSMDAAKVLLAKVYITMATAPLNEISNYTKARDMAKQVMVAGTHYLVHDIDQVFELANSYGPEMLWSFNATPDDYSTEPQIYLPESMAEGWGDIKPEVAWGVSFPEQPRKAAYLILEDWDGKPYTSFWWGGPGIRKFVYGSREDLENYLNIQNYSLLRYAEALLIFAEAENMVNNGPNQAACDAVNQIIDRANGYVENPADPRLTTVLSKKAFDDAVIQQRNWELCFEYDRWYDLIRKRILKEKTAPQYQQNFSDNDYLYPIPQTDLRINPLLTQNPGYSTPGGN